MFLVSHLAHPDELVPAAVSEWYLTVQEEFLNGIEVNLKLLVALKVYPHLMSIGRIQDGAFY